MVTMTNTNTVHVPPSEPGHGTRKGIATPPPSPHPRDIPLQNRGTTLPTHSPQPPTQGESGKC